jgi:hypothetical protein
MKRIFKLTILILTMTLSNLTQAGVAEWYRCFIYKIRKYSNDRYKDYL